ncbi:MAG: hypothetical protein WKF70_14925, partial [Chitinophagaceae bacterium]
VPEPLRTSCLKDFLATRQAGETAATATNYEEWLQAAFGPVFTQHFPEAYTRKYWTLPSRDLTTGWVGGRVFYPDVTAVEKGYEGAQEGSTHYISSIRYPKKGGYHRYAAGMEEGMQVTCNKEVQSIDLQKKEICFNDGDIHRYQTLISTLPLSRFVQYCAAPESIQQSAVELSCSQLLLLNFEVAHPALRTEQWLYVYDEEMYSTRINFTELLSPDNAPQEKCGIQVEVYYSKYKPLNEPIDHIREKVQEELVQMGLIRNSSDVENCHTQWIPFANVIFDHPSEVSLNSILEWLTSYGLVREEDDLATMTDWDEKIGSPVALGSLILAGRFSQWKYYWTDDCVLRGKYISDTINCKKQ